MSAAIGSALLDIFFSLFSLKHGFRALDYFGCSANSKPMARAWGGEIGMQCFARPDFSVPY
jgi:hypothetical protein